MIVFVLPFAHGGAISADDHRPRLTPGPPSYLGVIVDLDAFLPLRVAAMAAGVSTASVKFWRLRGWYSPDGEHHDLTVQPDGRGGYRYRLGDVLQAEADTAAHPNSRRQLAHTA